MKSNLIVPLLLIASCGIQSPNKNTTRIQVVNGQQTNQYPAVVNFVTTGIGFQQNCTGTFISQTVMLTATHCVEDATEINYNGHVAQDYIDNATLFNSVRDSVDRVKYDFALVRFASAVAPATMPITSKQIAHGDNVILVGFGHNDFDPNTGKPSFRSRPGIKRMGTNKYDWNDYLKDGIINFSGVYANRFADTGDGISASTGQGDSGGPLIVSGKGIVGVVAANGVSSNGIESFFADLTSIHAKQFMNRARNVGFLNGNSQPINPNPINPNPINPNPINPNPINPNENLVGVNSDRTPIPDASSSGAATEFEVESTKNVKSIKLKVELTHEFIGEISIYVESPSGKRVYVKPADWVAGRSLNQTYTVHDFSGQKASGVWKVVIADNSRGKTGIVSMVRFEILPI